MTAVCTLTGQSLSMFFSILPQVCLCHLLDALPLCGCGEGASGVSVWVLVCVCVKGLGPLEVCVRLLESKLSLCMCLSLSVHVLSSCLCESLLPLPELISRPCLSILDALSLILGIWTKICILSLDWTITQEKAQMFRTCSESKW